MFLFLQNWRATIIPTLAVPVVVLGTFAVINIFGFSINTLTMFAMVLAIGLLVDDAIVVVENVERVMSEDHTDPVTATSLNAADFWCVSRYYQRIDSGIRTNGFLWWYNRCNLPPVLDYPCNCNGSVVNCSVDVHTGTLCNYLETA